MEEKDELGAGSSTRGGDGGLDAGSGDASPTPGDDLPSDVAAMPSGGDHSTSCAHPGDDAVVEEKFTCLQQQRPLCSRPNVSKCLLFR